MRPSFLYFDLGNVLLNFDHRRASRQIAKISGATEDQVWQIVFQSELATQLETGEIEMRQMYDHFCHEVDQRPAFDAFELAFNEIFDYNATILPLVIHLEAARQPMGIISNTSQSHWDYCRSGRFGTIPASFDVSVLSYEVGVMKPDPKIYEVAAQKAGVPPAEIFFTDDRLENVAGARRAGFDALRYTSTAELYRELCNRGIRCNF